jgi:hypothetical protein
VKRKSKNKTFHRYYSLHHHCVWLRLNLRSYVSVFYSGACRAIYTLRCPSRVGIFGGSCFFNINRRHYRACFECSSLKVAFLCRRLVVLVVGGGGSSGLDCVLVLAAVKLARREAFAMLAHVAQRINPKLSDVPPSWSGLAYCAVGADARLTRFHHCLGESKFTECLKVQVLSG